MNKNPGKYTSLLKQEATMLQGLYGLLMKELDALKDRNMNSISELSEEKNTMLNKLGTLDKERQLFVENELHENESTQTNETSTLKREIEVCLEKCKQQNNINGGIIEMSRLFNEKILDIMYDNPDKQTTYTATGKNNSRNNPHSLARV